MQNSVFLQNWNQYSHESKVAVRDRTGHYSFREVTERAEAITSALLDQLSLKSPAKGPAFKGRDSLEGARIGILVEPGVGFVATFLGVVSAGGTAVVFSPLHPNVESAYFCQNAEVKAVLVSSAWRSQAEGFTSKAFILDIEAVCNEKLNFEKLTLIQNQASALQLYTSGTTGKPKGAVLTHENLAIQQNLLKDAWELQASDILLHTLPLHHMHGLCIALWSVLGAGGSVSFAYPFNAAQIWNELQNSTVFMAVPTIYAKLLAHWENSPLSDQVRWQAAAKNLRLATSGSAALPVTLAEKWKKLTGQYPLERFGMTEVGVALSNPLKGQRKSGRVGLPLPGVHFKVVDEAGEASAVGELWIGGPSLFLEYFNQPEANETAFTIQEGIRFFKTGDTVTRDEDGYFKILGRNSVDILKSGGYKLSAIEIEEVLREHPAVQEVAVVGVPDAIWGDRVIACVVLKKAHPATCSEDTLREFSKTQLAAYKVPKQVVFLDRLPSNALGKIMKQDLVKDLILLAKAAPSTPLPRKGVPRR